MPLAYLVMAHAQPEHVARLVQRLSTPEDVVIVHVDRKADLASFRAAFAAREVSPLVLERRIWVAWGGWSYVRAILAGMRAALRLDHPWSHLLLLSGADYPIRSAKEIQAHFATAPGRSFISWSLGDSGLTDEERRGNEVWSWPGDMSRMLEWTVTIRGRRWHLPNDTIQRMPPRRVPRALVPAQGLGWWNLSREAAELAVRTLRRRPDIPLFFRFAFAPDENVFQMVLLASPLRSRLVNEDLRFMHWDVNHPKILRLEDVDEMVASRKLFARKFDQAASGAALDELDRRAGVVHPRLAASPTTS